ncbi:radical SAM protein [Solobacterium moorei]|uniref:Radical SAM protein n=1 Tax=Solobacterium moorei TaxID=102148 RepID=A0A412PIQ2_9FIRM|nr:radical SAM protein [Solobacterium moorei]MDI6414467.1 radical SAM protein [Solobacterium moorei]RGT58067.1 radical SAM protein [Solobacterium moorei]
MKPKNLLNELADLKVKSVEFSGGGEPTTHPDIIEIIRHAKSLGLNIGIVTNGNSLEKLFPVLDAFTFIRISLDAATKDKYQFVHGVNTFESVINNISVMINLS